MDTLFRIMSMTKMPCTVVALQQVEQGHLDLDAPVASYCPEFAEIGVLDGFDGDTPRLRPPARPVTVRNLVTHTSGLGYWFWSEHLVKWERVTGVPNVVAGSAASFKAPLLADPGKAFIYGINIDWLGKVVEAVTGVGLDVAIKEGVTGPLGMDQTTFLMNDDQRPNSTPVHVKGEDGTWVSVGEILNQAPDWWPADTGSTGRRATTSSSSGRCCAAASSTAPGSCGSPRSTRPSPTRSATWTSPPSCRPATPPRPATSTPAPGFKWGYGLLLNTSDFPGMRRAWSGAWAGLCNTQFWVDRTTGVCRRHLQQLPAVRDARGLQAVQRLRAGALRVAVTRSGPASQR